ncbi:MAG TPA: molybdenum cofactor guanylyltransferase [Deltaproteobacteria bacterium]|nr:molybdenum cofactor guanylyltransferase [Deltaproteobacteria bacterium]
MTGFVLIGGRSRRFGKDKVTTQLGGRTLVEHVTDVISPLFDEVILIGHKRDRLGPFTVVEDILPARGPLGGIYTALSVSPPPSCFVFAADMPNLNRDFIRYMISVSDDHDVVIPLWSRGREPLHAIYNRRLLPLVGSLLERKVLRIFDVLKNADTFAVPEETIRTFGDPESMFANVNTVNDMDRLSS